MKDSLKIIGKVTIEVIRSSGETELIVEKSNNLVTDVGFDWIHNQIYNLGSSELAKYVALSTDSTTPDVSDTILLGEITNFGLSRSIGTVTYLSKTTTIVALFTSTGTHLNVQKAGIFSSLSSGTLIHENVFTPTNIYSSDQLRITWSISTS